METERSTYITIILAALFLILGTLTAHAQTATPTATPTPGVCAIPQTQLGATVDCRTGAENFPAYLGASGGNFNSLTVDKTGTMQCCAGTFGALVEDAKGNQYALGSNHILARTSSTTKAAAVNELIVQPGLVDLGCWQDAGDTVAKLAKWKAINFSAAATNTADIAIAKVVNGDLRPDGAILNIDQGLDPSPYPVSSLFIAMPVQKMGRGSCLTEGAIDALDARGKVVYPKTCNMASGGVATFDHQILVIGQAAGSLSGQLCNFTQVGDSGAIVLTYPGALGSPIPISACPQPIGVLFAAASDVSPEQWGPEQGGTIAAVTPMQTALTAFSSLPLTLVGYGSCSNDAQPPADNPVALLPAPDNVQPGSLASGLEGAADDPIAALPAAGPSAALRASIEAVRAVKNRHAARLLKIDEVTAVGIGAGNDRDHAALNVYLAKDTPAVRAKIPSEIDGVVVHIKHAAQFRAL